MFKILVFLIIIIVGVYLINNIFKKMAYTIGNILNQII